MIYLQLMWVYLKIGLFGFGGGYAVLSLIQHEVVEKYGWISTQEFADIVALSQMTPGPIGINSATYIGYAVTDSVWGAVVATIALCLPSFVIVLLVSRFLITHRNNSYVKSVFAGLRPVVVGLIASAALLLMNRENFVDYFSILICVVSFILLRTTRLHPIWMIIGAGVVGYLYY